MKTSGIVPTPSPLSKRLKGILLVVAASLFWGTAGIFIFKIVDLGGLNAAGLAFWRNLLSSLILLIAILIIDPKLLIVKKKKTGSG